MRTRWLRLLPLFVAALWLPCQAVAATAMSYCRHGEAQQTMAAADAAMDHCAMHGQQQPAPDHGASCDDCGFCQLAAAGFIPTAEHAAPLISAAQDYRVDPPRAPASAIPEPPQQPPKRTA